MASSLAIVVAQRGWQWIPGIGGSPAAPHVPSPYQFTGAAVGGHPAPSFASRSPPYQFEGAVVQFHPQPSAVDTNSMASSDNLSGMFA